MLDLFSGSGTTSIVARDLGREFVGCEANKEYLDCGLEVILGSDNG